MPADVVCISKISEKSSFLCKSSLVKDDENVWAWSDGSEWDFWNWYRNEPNNSGGRDRKGIFLKKTILKHFLQWLGLGNEILFVELFHSLLSLDDVLNIAHQFSYFKFMF